MQILRRVAVPLLLVVCSLLTFFLLLEIALRTIGHPRHEARILCFDAVMGNVYCPNIEERLDNMYQSTLLVTTNSEGMADREYPKVKPERTTRVALLGDSVTASLYTPNAEKFKSVWEQSLAQPPGQPVEFMNFAVDGTGTWEQLQMFHLRARKYRPDLVVLAFYWGNDVWNNMASRDKGRANPLKDEYSVPSWLMNVRVAHRKSIRWLWNNSAAYQFLDTLKDKIQTTLDYKRALPASPQSAPVSAEAKPAPEAQYDPGFAWDSEAWSLTRQLILKLKDETEQSGARLLVFHMPTLDQLGLPKPLPYSQFRGFLDQHGIAHADAFDALSGLSPEQTKALYISDHWHLSTAGHRFFARASLPVIEKFVRAPMAAEKRQP
jgi:lysophospholipase L1-like esterase